MKALIITPTIGPTSELLKDEFKKRGHSIDFLMKEYFDIADLSATKDFDASKCDIIDCKGGLNSTARSIVAQFVSENGIPFMNHAIHSDPLILNKVHQVFNAAKSGVKVPKTIVRRYAKHDDLVKILGEKYVVKVTTDSCGGVGVAMIKSVKNHIEFQKENRGAEYLYQEFIKYSGDYRVNVIGGKAVCAFHRVGVEGDFRANLSLGGSMKKIEDESLLKDLYEKAEQVIKFFPGAENVGMDFIVSEETSEIYFLEVNLSPWTRDIHKITGVDIGAKMVDYFEEVVKGNRS